MKKIDIYDKTFYVTLLIVTVVVTALFIISDQPEPNEPIASIVDDGVCIRGDPNEPDCESCHLADPLLEKASE